MRISANDPARGTRGNRNRANRTIVTLLLVALSGIAAHHATADPVVEKLNQSTTSWEGSLLPAYPAGQPEIQILRITVPPRTTLPMHKHPGINAGYLLQGMLTVVTEDGKRLELAAGDTIVEVVDLWHFGTNEGVEPAVILVFHAGVEGTPLSIPKHEAHSH